MDEKIASFREIIEQSDNIVFFGGAGVSTESGIPDFRGDGGLYYQKYDYPPETILSFTFFDTQPDEFYRFYRDKLMIAGAEPNMAHIRLAELEREGKLRAVVTQNIDGLHQAAGSVNVLEVHGTTMRLYCTECFKEYTPAVVEESEGVTRCICGGIIRPDVVLYQERLDDSTMSKAARYISECDVLIVGGTSLNVYPAAGLVNYYQGDKLVLINLQPTPYDGQADLLISEKIGEVFSKV